jgi:hypothetical protein
VSTIRIRGIVDRYQRAAASGVRPAIGDGFSPIGSANRSGAAAAIPFLQAWLRSVPSPSS